MESSNLLKDRKLSTLKGIGDKSEKLFEKAGVSDLNQLLHFYPRAYDAYGKITEMDSLVSGEKQSVAIVVTRPPVVKQGSRSSVTILTVSIDFVKLEVIWYHMPYLRKMLVKGARFILRGMVYRRKGKWLMEHPEVITPAAYDAMAGTVQPVYSLTAGLTNKAVQKAVRQLLEKYEISDYLPESDKEKYSLADRETALKNIHFPENAAALKEARRRLVFDEFLIYMLRLQSLKDSSAATENNYPVDEHSASEAVVSSLGYELTGAQKRVWNEIKEDMRGKTVMNRLIQGDVGSGKTILCFLAMISAAQSGHQSALMAPTEVLAKQHYDKFIRLSGLKNAEAETVLLTGSNTAKEKREIYEKIASGEAKYIIGTHALFQEKVAFSDLALVVTDEQHRFGVRQRTALGEKGKLPHVMVMSATPIPRTLALILYGDLKISVLDEMPANRLRIKNAVVDTSYRNTAYKFMAKEIAAGHQVYVVCPMIEKNEDLNCENVLDYALELKKVFGSGINIGILHGRMKAAEKNEVMRRFSEKEIDILVSTTVIEVGVDVPDATVMMIENADRFGLAQLHQLRGRVGRGDAQSYCIFVQSEGKEETNERLEILGNSNDGFYIAEQDLKLRGQGDLFGLRQSGIAGFTLADVYEDGDILSDARRAADDIMNSDPGLKSDMYKELREIIGTGPEDTMAVL
ncbi:MAG: ATP-dependent DNA helicase RecG [Lachnospiraceae bacterium]|nr:ATP-dependent DNA helicase RecG [Lachnospiraceae bacterium]